jgi:hypothetical protein
MLDILNIEDYPQAQTLHTIFRLNSNDTTHVRLYRHPSGYAILEYIRREPDGTSGVIQIFNPSPNSTSLTETSISGWMPHNRMTVEQIENAVWHQLEGLRKHINNFAEDHPFTK